MSVKVIGSDAIDPEPLNLSKPKHGHGKVPARDVKQTLKSLIRSRRIAEGKSEIEVDLEKEKPKCELTPEEKTRQRERKEQNRKAAMRCRERKKKQLQVLQMEEDKLLERRSQLKNSLQDLAQQKESLLSMIRSSGSSTEQYTCAASPCGFHPKNQDDSGLSAAHHLTADYSQNDSKLSSRCHQDSKGVLDRDYIHSQFSESSQSSSCDNRTSYKRKKFKDISADSTSDTSDSDDENYLRIVSESESEDSNQNSFDDSSQVLDLSFSTNKVKQRYNLESSESDSQHMSSQDSVDSQRFSWHDDSDSHPSGIHDRDQILSSQESQPISSQDSIDGRFMKHGSRHCDTSITVNN